MVQWNSYTWYSKFLAILLFILVIPVLSFYVGVQYEKTSEVLSESNVIIPAASMAMMKHSAPMMMTTTNSTTTTTTSSSTGAMASTSISL